MNIPALVLAAGQSSRMGDANKLLMEIDGTPLVYRAVDAALASRADPVFVVVGHEAPLVRQALARRNVTFVHNDSYREGLSTSLRRGLRALPEGIDAVIICLGDMPRVTHEHIDRLVAAFAEIDQPRICMPVYQGRRGNPVLWPQRFIPEMLEIHGDSGARSLITKYPDQVVDVEMPDDGVLIDVDTRADL